VARKHAFCFFFSNRRVEETFKIERMTTIFIFGQNYPKQTAAGDQIGVSSKII
jgi:hypothetical protein